ncbi:hypothetical protein K437DRAFT_65686 [Tilletiaria anomala UBC 951]|uniref:Uncharacterized protein n=1 Tax=Tilletiaria anomala (strain ATCC 24038 / CBS 436.72 / UBC 951) TaxID=1037660 RepID=A0A066W8W1_TILAU|nr:uncharacterized protein K437DRAFT_65686 [Tilletiaria anomala UBC 951]KDN50377.1 hypothetical protein K437DRAFT_65686 [Tilletiaria anomala UBC 951]
MCSITQVAEPALAAAIAPAALALAILEPLEAEAGTMALAHPVALAALVTRVVGASGQPCILSGCNRQQVCATLAGFGLVKVNADCNFVDVSPTISILFHHPVPTSHHNIAVRYIENKLSTARRPHSARVTAGNFILTLNRTLKLFVGFFPMTVQPMLSAHRFQNSVLTS